MRKTTRKLLCLHHHCSGAPSIQPICFIIEYFSVWFMRATIDLASAVACGQGSGSTGGGGGTGGSAGTGGAGGAGAGGFCGGPLPTVPESQLPAAFVALQPLFM